MSTRSLSSIRRAAAVALLSLVSISLPALGQNGVSDDRVSLPDGPGSLGGVGENVDVNANMGSASFRVPIRVPEGQTADTTPSLALTYASGAGTGVAGIGWSIPTPSIERMVSKGLPTYTTDDRFVADGSLELVFVSDADGPREYRQRYEGAFIRYRWHGASAGEAGYWTAELPDGSVGTYGATADGTLVPAARVSAPGGETFRYHLVEMQDAVGRRVVYTYTKDAADGWPLLDEIRYGYGTGATPYFFVRFVYEDRPDVTTTATPGHLIRLTQRLDEIEVVSNNVLIRRYDLAYEAELDSGGLSRLGAIAEYGRDGGKTPLEHTFAYSRSLAGTCEQGCEQPFMVGMGTLQNGVSIDTGRAALIDINGDSLPDVVASDATGDHRFYIADLAFDGRPTFTTNAGGTTSDMGGTANNFLLGSAAVQLFDINGDGFTDIVDRVNGTALCNFGTGDWESEGCATDPAQLPTLSEDPDDADSEQNPLHVRFFDYDNDKQIDLLQTPTAGTATVYRNTGEGFTSEAVGALEAQFDEERLELSDVNGDGLQDAVMLVGNGADSFLRYKLHLGYGNWEPAAGFTEVTLTGLSATDLDNAVLEDLDGDGLSDVVVVSGQTVSYWRNRSNGQFDAAVSIGSADVDGTIPDRDGTQTVLFADMNGNGTDDVVWVSSGGQVQFLEIFPVRPNLLTRVDNGIGWIRTLTYTTSSAERARDEGTVEAWPHELPLAMQIVKSTDTFTTVNATESAGLHERVELEYHAGYYDPTDKAFRGFEVVDRFLLADDLDSQEPGRERLTYDIGKDALHRHGLLLRRAIFGGDALDAPLREDRMVYQDCPVAEVGGADVVWACKTQVTVIHQERQVTDDWLTVVTDFTYDGYGNVVEEHRHGVAHQGPPEAPLACATCEGSGGLHGAYCGAMCLGDEMITETTYVAPGDDTAGAWLLRLPVRETRTAAAGGATSETVTYYDGAPFVGLAEGQATRGLVSRQMGRVDDGPLIPGMRYAYNAAGDLETELQPNGDPGDLSNHTRTLAYGDNNLRVTKVTMGMGDYDLVQDVTYEASFKKARQATAFYVVEGGAQRTPSNATTWTYDEHGRVLSLARPGDTDQAPTEEYTYELGDPVSRVVTRERRSPGGAADVVTVSCLDGRGREVQRRRQVSDTEWLVDGFNLTNSRGLSVRRYEPFTASSGACETEPPADVVFSELRYDALGREIGITAPDDEVYGTASEVQTVFLPLLTEAWDAEDTDPTSPHADNPVRTWRNGLDRPFRVERLLTATEIGVYRVAYDDLGYLAAVTDPGGNVIEQEHDRLGRVVAVVHPDSAATTFDYDFNGNVTSRTDGRGITVLTEYDALDRNVATWEADDEEGTKQTSIYDWDESCASCVNGAGAVVKMSYPALDGTGTDEIGYDVRGRTVLRRRTLEGVAFETTWVFNGTDDLASVTYPDGRVVEYEYDASRRVVAIPGLVDEVTYTDRDLRARIERANGTEDTLAHDVIQRPEAQTLGGVYDVTLTRDRLGNLETVTSQGSGLSHDATYGRDAWYRLTAADVGADAEELSVAYDLVDNITSMVSSLGAESPAHQGDYAYDEAGPHAVSSTDVRSYAYDEAGYTTARGAHTFEWDHFGRLVRATDGEGRVSRYAYASDGTRVAKEAEGGIVYYPATDFEVRDGISNVYVALDNQLVARQRSDALATTVLPDGDGDGTIDVADAVTGPEALRTRMLRAAARRLLFADEGETMHLHSDLAGSVLLATDESGEVRGERAYYPYGELRQSTGFVDVHGFTGQERDDETGLWAFPFRYLDAAAGRWASPDPAFAVLTLDNYDDWGESTTGYAYVSNSPVDLTDPTGLSIGTKIKAKAKKLTTKKQQNGARTKKKLKLKSKTVDNVARIVPGGGTVLGTVRMVRVLAPKKGAKWMSGREARFNTVVAKMVESDIRRVGKEVGTAGDSLTYKTSAKFRDASRAKRTGMTAKSTLFLSTHVLRSLVGLPNAFSPTVIGGIQGAVRKDKSLK